MNEPTVPYSSSKPERLQKSLKTSEHAQTKAAEALAQNQSGIGKSVSGSPLYGHEAIYHSVGALRQTEDKARALLNRITGSDEERYADPAAKDRAPCLGVVLIEVPVMIHQVNETTFDLIDQAEKALFGDRHG